MIDEKTFEFCAGLMIAESRAATKALEGRLAQEFFTLTLGLRLDVEQSYAAWQEILRQWEKEKSAKGSTVELRRVVVNCLLESEYLSDPIVTEFSEFQRLRFSSSTDHLTGLHNRRFFDSAVKKEVPRARRYGEDLSLILFDLNRFKEANDTRGHAFGDQLLVLAAGIMKEQLRVSDSAFRVGGDEFAILLPQTAHPGAVILAERMRNQFAREVAPMKLEVPVSLAYGVATCPREATEPSGFFDLADKRLYDFKRSIGSPRCAPRRHKRISTEGLGAYAVVRTDDQTLEAKLIDFSFGGVGLRIHGEASFPPSFLGDLHLPVFPPVSVTLHKVYSQPENTRGHRLGCAFLEPSPPAAPLEKATNGAA